MIDFNKLVIVGDSFCADYNDPRGWPYQLSVLLNKPMVNYAFGGQSWWACKKFIDSLKINPQDKNLLIVVHTEPTRIPNDFELPVTPGVLHIKPGQNHDLSGVKNSSYIVKLAQDFYSSALFSAKFYEWAQQCWIKELEATNGKFAKIIHIPAFNTVSMNNVTTGIVVQPSPEIYSLRKLSEKELADGDAGYSGFDSRLNHLNETNNTKLAEALYEIITSAEVGPNPVYFKNLSEWDFTKRPFIQPAEK